LSVKAKKKINAEVLKKKKSMTKASVSKFQLE
jgi:hypothetical protein